MALAHRSPLRNRALWIAAAVLLVGAAGAAAWWNFAGRGPGAAGVPSFAASAARGASAARVAFLAPDAGGTYNLYAVAAAGGAPQALTAQRYGVWDYAVSPDGRTIAASVLRGAGEEGGELWLLDNAGRDARRLLDCAGAVCRAPAWSPDGGRIAFERRTPAAAGSERADIWVTALDGRAAPLLPGDDGAGHSPQWSPDGTRIAFVTLDAGHVQVVEIAGGAHTTVDTQLGEPPSWAPDGRRLVAADITPMGEQFLTHLFVADLAAGSSQELAAHEQVEDGSPAWSPRGDLIAFGRKLYGDAPTLGRQLWLTRPDGTGARALTADLSANFSAPAWSPDGARLAVVRFDLGDASAQPAILVFDVAAGSSTRLAQPGTQPEWLP